MAIPGWQPGSGPLDIADPAIGGHIAWFDPQPYGPDMLDGMLTPDAGLTLFGFDARETSMASWAIGFQDGRAAQATEIGWVDRARLATRAPP